jgi:outer membrane protein assembly factor BamD (BamD/ComL family)
MTNDEIPKYSKIQGMTKDKYQMAEMPSPTGSPILAQGNALGNLATPMIRRLKACLIGIGLILLCSPCTVTAASFDDQLKSVRVSTATQPETAILALLKAGLEEGKPAQAIAETTKWLSQNQPKDAMLLYHAGRSAELSGDWKDSLALYQQYLKGADLKSATADEAVYAVHVLLLDRLKDLNAAYAFARTDGGRLLVCPRARQFDAWFLDEAVKRNDVAAVAMRLHACIAAGYPAELLDARYSPYFLWLLGQVDGLCANPNIIFTQDIYDAVKDLCEVMTHNEEMKLRLDWAVSVKAYNVAKIGDETKQKVIPRRMGKKKSDAKEAAAQAVEEKKVELGEDAVPPIAESAALLEKFPRHVLWVMTGWAGGGNGPYHRGDFKKYWPHEAEAKMAPILAALSKLTPAEAADFLNAAAYGGYVSNPGVLEIRAVRNYVRDTPELWKQRNGVVILPREWNQLSLEEAQNLAPRLEQIANPQASLVRAIAAGGKDYEKVMAALLGPEVWRLGPNELNHVWGNMLWGYCGSPASPLGRDQGIAKINAVGASFAAGDAKKEDPADKRIAAFRNLWADYKSAQPKIPYAKPRAAAILTFSPELVPELLKDPNPEAQGLLRVALAAGMQNDKGPVERDGRAAGIPHSAYNPWILRLAAVHGGIDRMKQVAMPLYAPHPLESVLRAAVAERLAQGKIEPWLTMAWINMQFPEDNAEPVKLMQALLKSPAWAGMPFEVQFGAREWFKKDAMTPGQANWIDAADPALLFKNLIELPKEADAAATAAALAKAIEGVRKSPVKIDLQGLPQLGTVTNAVFTDPKVMSLMLDVTDGLRFACDPASGLVGAKLLAHVTENPDPVVLHRVGAFLWSCGLSEHYAKPLPPTLQLAQSLLEAQPATAAALARTGLAVVNERVGGHQAGWAQGGGWAALKSLTNKSAMKMGLAAIPVAADHPAYPVYQSQAEWLAGNEESAWKLLDAKWEVFLPMHRDLEIAYQMWALEMAIRNRDEARQEALVKPLLAWIAEANCALTPTERARIEIAYGDIALQRNQLPQARELFLRIQQNKAYENLPVRHEAALHRVRAERIAKDFEAALKTLADLELEREPAIWSATRYARSEVRFDMEEFDDAADDIESILTRDPDHADAKILLGKVQLRRKKLMEATEVELGAANSRQWLVPGQRLKVTLNDPTLAVSGAGTTIEVVVRAKSGDEETFFLRQFGDQKTKFRGEVVTALGAPAPGDGTLQVIGDDEVSYAYSERFRKQMNNLDEMRGGAIRIASDATLMASSRKLLSEIEQRTADMEAVMAELKRQGVEKSSLADAARANLAARSLDASVRAAANKEEGLTKIDERFISNVTKPGNPIHIRVVDADRSRTSGIDELMVNLSSTSGDTVSQVTLRETGPYTGWFEGSVPTAAAQALAFANNSEPGRNPNMVISATDTYPAWQPVTKAGVSPEFTVDLNDNVALGELKITAREPGAKLKKFFIQTGMSAADMTTVAAYPKNLISIQNPWGPSVTIMNDTDPFHAAGGRSVHDLDQLVDHMERGWMSQQFAQGLARNVAGPSEALPTSIPTDVKWVRNGYIAVSSVIYRFRGYFHEPAEVTRRFRLDLGNFTIPADTHPSLNHPPQFLLAVDGKPITVKDGKLEGEAKLKPGLHSFEIWGTGWVNNIGFGRTVKLLANLGEAGQMADCPDKFFDPAAFPPSLLDHRNGAAQLSASEDGTSFTATFAKDSRTRLIRLVFSGQEGPVPVLNKLALTTPDNKKILPVAEDFATLNKNDKLEIISGDKITVRYVDDRPITAKKDKHERFLDVAFTDGRVEFADIEPRFDPQSGEDRPYREMLLRFHHDAPLPLVVYDWDMDSTVKPDKVKVTLASEAGGSREFEAVETGDSTGVFKVMVTPVAGKATGDKQFQVVAGGTLTARYRDAENNRPGVPYERVATITHAAYAPPVIRLAHARVSAIDPKNAPPAQKLAKGFERPDPETHARAAAISEVVTPRWQIDYSLLDSKSAPEGGFATVHGHPIFLEVVAPHLAISVNSSVTLFAQTESGRRLKAPAAGVGFDLNVPGTLELGAGLAGAYGGGGIASYTSGMVMPIEETPPDDRFRLNIPLIAGVIPPMGVISAEERNEMRKSLTDVLRSARTDALVVSPGDTVHLGFRFRDAAGAEQWATASAKVITHPVFDIMTEDFRSQITSAYVGETLNLRVVDLGGDTSDTSDTVSVLVQAKSGAKARVDLRETGPHTGIFKGGCTLAYATPAAPAKPAPVAPDSPDDTRATDAEEEEAPQPLGAVVQVVYGDTVAARYTDANGIKTETALVTVSKGADGEIRPFSKIYQDSEIAMRSQFSLAEANLEMAKRHRLLGNAEAALLQYTNAKQLLASAMNQFTDPETRSHAEFLLGNLTFEEADTTADAALKQVRYRAALARFMNVTGSYPDTLHASKAQYRIALVYEALKEPDIAAQEYVKLAYKYPDSEYIATSMARLGSYFLKSATAYEEKAKPLLAKGVDETGKVIDKDAAFEGQAMQKMAFNEFIKTARIFGRLQERFPDDELAGQAGLRAGHAYFRAARQQDALTAFLRVIGEEGYDGPNVRSQAMYWAGMCYQQLQQPMAAYSIFKRLTYDFPESQWAAYARAQLSQENMLNLETDLEIKRLEEGP